MARTRNGGSSCRVVTLAAPRGKSLVIAAVFALRLHMLTTCMTNTQAQAPQSLSRGYQHVDYFTG